MRDGTAFRARPRRESRQTKNVVLVTAYFLGAVDPRRTVADLGVCLPVRWDRHVDQCVDGRFLLGASDVASLRERMAKIDGKVDALTGAALNSALHAGPER